MSRMHVFWYRLTNGVIGGRIRGASVLLLSTVGRKSGNKRTTPLLYLEDGENLVLVASNGGPDRNPAWFTNLKQNLVVEVQVRGERGRMRAEQAPWQEKSRLWPLVTGMYHQYEDYQRKTEREIPVVILRPSA